MYSWVKCASPAAAPEELLVGWLLEPDDDLSPPADDLSPPADEDEGDPDDFEALLDFDDLESDDFELLLLEDESVPPQADSEKATTPARATATLRLVMGTPIHEERPRVRACGPLHIVRTLSPFAKFFR